MKFSVEEIRDLAISWGVLALAFTKFYSYLSRTFFNIRLIPLMIVMVGTAFVLHELAHKAQAQRYGHQAEYRMWPAGLLLALASSFAGIIFAAPGAVYIGSYYYDEKEQGRIALAGPLANMAVSLASFVLHRLFGSTLFVMIAGINASIALFNLLPFGPLDGRQIMKYNRVVWACLFILALFVVFAR